MATPVNYFKPILDIYTSLGLNLQNCVAISLRTQELVCFEAMTTSAFVLKQFWALKEKPKRFFLLWLERNRADDIWTAAFTS